MSIWHDILLQTADGSLEQVLFLKNWIRRYINKTDGELYPYLRLVGPQISGKSAFVLAMSKLGKLTRWYPHTVWNGELKDANLVHVEDVNFRYVDVMSRMQDVLREDLTIQRKGQDTVTMKNRLRFIEEANQEYSVPWLVKTFRLQSILTTLSTTDLNNQLDRGKDSFVAELFKQE